LDTFNSVKFGNVDNDGQEDNYNKINKRKKEKMNMYTYAHT
jgi:hypothetical protein